MNHEQPPEQVPDQQPQRVDRRRRHAADPTIGVTVSIPVALRQALDAVVVARGATRSGMIAMAVRAWLERQERREGD